MKKIIIATLFILLFKVVNAQEIPSKFIVDVDSLISLAPITYAEIDLVFRKNRRDTVLMRYVVSRSSIKNYLEGQMYAYNQLGTRYRNTSQFKKSINFHQKALDIANRGKSLEFKVYSLNMLGVVYRKIDAIKTALEFNHEALELAETIENPSDGLKRSINVSLNSIGNIYEALKQYDLAIDYFKKSLHLEKELGNTLGMAINHQNIGKCLEEQNKIQEALENYKISFNYNEQIGSEKGKIICSNRVARIYIKQKKAKEALKILEPNLIASTKLGDQYITAALCINLGWAFLKLKQYNKSNDYLFKGLELAKKYDLARTKFRAYSLLSDLSQERGNYATALSYYKKAETYDKEISNERNIRYVNDMIIRYDTEKKNNQIKVLAKENEIVKLQLQKNKTSLIVSSIVLILLAGILYILYRQYQLKNEKKLLTLEQTMLRSQMNPHFLFNSLNSIKLYIINNEKKNAVYYLNKFSKLIRKILEASSLKEISLADELETVELYMNIENIRFSNEINFTIDIDDDINTNNIKIPSLILQPFLENALWHGLSTKEGEKRINLKISKESDYFTKISIIDNGVGRVVSEKINKSKLLKRKSVGIDITKERLTNFSKDYQNSFEVEIKDLYDAKKATGTEVVLYIPKV